MAHLASEQQVRALHDLENLRTQKQSRLRQALEQAYGLLTPDEATLDLSHAAERSLHLLKPGAESLEPRLAASLTLALDAYAQAVLDKRYPRHPNFGKKVTSHAIREAATLFGEVAETDERRIVTSKQRVEIAELVLAPLGLARVVEGGAVHLVEDRRLAMLERERHRRVLERPTVGEMKEILDESRQIGLPPQLEDLVVRCYARYAGRELVFLDRAYDADAGRTLPSEVVLERPDLPSQEAWSGARARAAELFGYSSTKVLLGAENMRALERAVLEKLTADYVQVVLTLPSRIEAALHALTSLKTGARLTTARSAAALVDSLRNKRGRTLIEALADAKLETSNKAVEVSLRTAKSVDAILRNELALKPLEHAARSQGSLRLSAINDRILKLLEQDEVVLPLAVELERLAREALSEMEKEVPVAPPIVTMGAPTNHPSAPFVSVPSAPTPGVAPRPLAARPKLLGTYRDTKSALEETRATLASIDAGALVGKRIRVEVTIEDDDV